MAYYSSPKQYENTTGKRFSENRPCILNWQRLWNGETWIYLQ